MRDGKCVLGMKESRGALPMPEIEATLTLCGGKGSWHSVAFAVAFGSENLPVLAHHGVWTPSFSALVASAWPCTFARHLRKE